MHKERIFSGMILRLYFAVLKYKQRKKSALISLLAIGIHLNRMNRFHLLITIISFCTFTMARMTNPRNLSITENKSIDIEKGDADEDTEMPSKENAYVLKWKKGKVPYKISEPISSQLKEAILEAVEEWNQDFRHCLIWAPHENQRDFVVFEEGPLCYSEIGRIKSKQEIVLDAKHCNNKGSILHEMAHTIGFTHEHNRPDRDEYIQVHFLNIPYEWRKQYAKEEFEYELDLGPYDYCSLMHYEIKSPDRNKPAFKILKKGVNETCVGQRNGFTDIDKQKLRNFYCSKKDKKKLAV